jgi:3',5'-cyclic AMP phosphodiesterase CpdA
MKDIGIVHITDLHYPNRSAAKWREPFMHAMSGIPDDTLQIRGLAVTGDLVDSPNETGFRNVAAFLNDVAKVLRLPGASEEEQGKRIWIVDGNHDYRAFGNIRISRQGIVTGGYLRRVSKYTHEEEGLLVIGLNSCSTGQLARGGVSQSDLDSIASLLDQDRDFLAAARYRVALIHHHLLPLPAQPTEHLGRIGRALSKVFDPGFKLLKNGGLVTRYLLQNGFDLVLHGHEHQAFAASISYHDLQRPASLSVVGGVAAAEGFQVIRFQAHGGVYVEKHSYVPTEGAVVRTPKMLLWNHADWQRMEWERASRSSGWYRRLQLEHVLDAIGDVEETDEIIEIHAGDGKTIERIDREVFVNPEHLGSCEIQSIYDKEDDRFYSRSQISDPSPRIQYSIDLKPAARPDRPHKGFIIKYMLYNGFSVTARDAVLRNQTDFC